MAELTYTQQVSVAYLNMQCVLNLLLKAGWAAVTAEVARLVLPSFSDSHAGAFMCAYCYLVSVGVGVFEGARGGGL